MSTPLLEVRGLKTCFFSGSRVARAVDGVSFEVAEGEALALVGESGSGKTATALSILRLVPDPPGRIVAGEVWFQGRELVRLNPREMRTIRGRDIAMVFQDPMSSLNPVQSVGKQITEAVLAHSKVSRQAAWTRAVELLGQVGIPDPETCVLAFPHQLSGGMRQRVLISMALACRPRLLIADEPTTALDATVQMQVIELLRRLMRELSMSLLVITHDMGVVAELADRVAVMYAGRIVEMGSVGEVFDRPLHPYTKGLFASLPRLHVPKQVLTTIPGEVPDPHLPRRGCAFVGRCPIEVPACIERDPSLIEAGPGRLTACLRVEQGTLPFGPDSRRAIPAQWVGQHLTTERPPLLEVRDITKHFQVHKGPFRRITGAVRAVDGISFVVREGETLSLVGESGCGKTTAGRVVLRLIESTGGDVLFAGESVAHATQRRLRELRREMQIIFQDPFGSLNPRRTVEGIVEEGLVNFGVPARQRRERVAQALERVGLNPGEHLHRYPHEFSGGQRQRIGIARAIVVRPRFIVCDEAVSSLDVSVQAQVLNLLLGLQKDNGTTYLFISHDLNIVRHLSDHVAVMYLGRLVEIGPAAVVTGSPHHPYTRELLASAPAIHPRLRAARAPLGGEVPSPMSPPRGCRFHTRCPLVMDRCRVEEPPPVTIGPAHTSWCFLDPTRGGDHLP